MKALLIVLVAVTSAFAGNASIAGSWTVQTTFVGNVSSSVCTLQQDGAKVTGKCKSPDGIESTMTGGVQDQKVSLKQNVTAYGQAMVVSYSGTISSPTSFAGNVEVKPPGTAGTFSAKKK